MSDPPTVAPTGAPSAASPRETVPGHPTLIGQLRRAARAVRRAVVMLMRVVARALRWLVRTWKRSLQFRVVTTTVVLCFIVLSLLGSFLYGQIASGLEADRIRASELEARSLTAQAQSTWDSTTETTTDELNNSARDIMDTILRPVGQESSRYVVVLRSLRNDNSRDLIQLASGGVGEGAVSMLMRRSVAADPSRVHQQIADVLIDGTRTPVVVVGSAIEVPNAGPYDLFFMFPLTQELHTMELVSNAFGGAGVILTALVGAVAWVVTRQVVTPVRRAAEVSERLASGQLGERLPVRGEDDLALLATSYNAMADSLQAQIRQLEGLSRVQQRFVSDVSHELRTPLTTIRMAGTVLYDAREDFEPVPARSAELLHGEIDRFDELLSDLLEISRFDAGAAALHSHDTDLRDLVTNVIEAAEPLALAKGSEVSMNADGPMIAEVDPRRVERILRNLVVNAIEHGEGKPVAVHLRNDDDAVAIVVEDEGVGLASAEAAMVFTRFWRADPARARTTGGTGLGLAIALEDARLHHGWLQAWGEPGVGSRFRLTLPRRAGETLSASPLPLSPGERQ